MSSASNAGIPYSGAQTPFKLPRKADSAVEQAGTWTMSMEASSVANIGRSVAANPLKASLGTHENGHWIEYASSRNDKGQMVMQIGTDAGGIISEVEQSDASKLNCTAIVQNAGGTIAGGNPLAVNIITPGGSALNNNPVPVGQSTASALNCTAVVQNASGPFAVGNPLTVQVARGGFLNGVPDDSKYMAVGQSNPENLNAVVAQANAGSLKCTATVANTTANVSNTNPLQSALYVPIEGTPTAVSTSVPLPAAIIQAGSAVGSENPLYAQVQQVTGEVFEVVTMNNVASQIYYGDPNPTPVAVDNAFPVVLTRGGNVIGVPNDLNYVSVGQSNPENLNAVVAQANAGSLRCTAVVANSDGEIASNNPLDTTLTVDVGGTPTPVSATVPLAVQLSKENAVVGNLNPLDVQMVGAVGVVQATASSLLAQVSQPTASSLNATVVQGTPSSLKTEVSQPVAGELNATVVQGTASNLLAQVSQPTAASLNATVVQGTASNLLAEVSQPTAANLNCTAVLRYDAGLVTDMNPLPVVTEGLNECQIFTEDGIVNNSNPVPTYPQAPRFTGTSTNNFNAPIHVYFEDTEEISYASGAISADTTYFISVTVASMQPALAEGAFFVIDSANTTFPLTGTNEVLAVIAISPGVQTVTYTMPAAWAIRNGYLRAFFSTDGGATAANGQAASYLLMNIITSS